MIMLILIMATIVCCLFLYSTCVVSSRCSREEEKYEQTRNV